MQRFRWPNDVVFRHHNSFGDVYEYGVLDAIFTLHAIKTLRASAPEELERQLADWLAWRIQAWRPSENEVFEEVDDKVKELAEAVLQERIVIASSKAW